jgi:hypothetical protein
VVRRASCVVRRASCVVDEETMQRMWKEEINQRR